MAIRLVEDLGAPGLVTVADIATEATMPNWNEWVAYILAGGGYLAAWMRFGGDFMKNVGIASFPWAARKLYNRVMGTTVPALAARRMSQVRAPARGISAGARITQTVKPGFEGVEIY